MGTFKDTSGREWTITLTVGALKRIRSIAGLDLMPLFGGQDRQESEAVRTLLLDPLRMADVVYAALKPQLDEAQINDEAFGELLAGPVLAAAAEAFLDAATVFIGATQGDAAAGFLRVATAKRDEARKTAWNQAAMKLAAIDVGELAKQGMDGKLSTAPPDSSA
jgi:hypothetical protein